ncbi:MAG: hypothetical protein WDO71_16850 [Bacteroidota bacterium]
MNKPQIIKKLAAGLMLLLFALSITPKQLLHDVITGHTHNYAKFEKHSNFQASSNNIQCNWHNQLVESPFTDQPDFQLDHPAVVHSSPALYYTLHDYFTDRFFSSLRGPPGQA